MVSSKSAWIILLALIAGLLLLPGCGKKTPLKADQQMYAGKWVAADGTYVQIFLDGSGKVQTGNTTIDGGQVTIEGSTLKVDLFGISKSWHIDRPPREDDGQWTMVLDNITYAKQTDAM